MGQLRTANRRHRRATRLQGARAFANTGTPRFLTASAGAGRKPANDADTFGVRPSARVEILDSALIPGGGTLELARCGGEFSIQYRSDELMGSHDHVSEEALATRTFERSGGGGDVLIGGLGMGFTLRAALSAWPTTARFVVAEGRIAGAAPPSLPGRVCLCHGQSWLLETPRRAMTSRTCMPCRNTPAKISSFFVLQQSRRPADHASEERDA